MTITAISTPIGPAILLAIRDISSFATNCTPDRSSCSPSGPAKASVTSSGNSYPA